MWNLGRAFRPMWDSSAECTCISELMFTLGLEHSTVRLTDIFVRKKK
ncbi:unnamed protein product [Schistosoma margrebowiei]|uniref:Uncharacterized protein n=1 Tax=Schistosoma margrebowiei TaxID=48269 RepID=A0A3P8E083_9TREM|nr:unnamed protein product [Schistosoma margrebowiei]